MEKHGMPPLIIMSSGADDSDYSRRKKVEEEVLGVEEEQHRRAVESAVARGREAYVPDTRQCKPSSYQHVAPCYHTETAFVQSHVCMCLTCVPKNNG